jgi:multiple sugar transport system permease protein
LAPARDFELEPELRRLHRFQVVIIDEMGYFPLDRIGAQIRLPLAESALAAVAIFTVQARWNEFLMPLILINRQENLTLALGLRLFRELYYVDWTGLMAATTVVILPALVTFFFGQRYFVQGIACSRA